MKKNEPEIIADAPFRIEPTHPIPVLLLIKDAHRFPIQLEKVIIKISVNGNIIFEKNYPIHIAIENDRYWHYIIFIKKPDDCCGLVHLDVQFIIKSNGKIKTFHNDNYRISSHKPLRVFLAEETLPRFDNWYFGDFHYHSNYTEDQVEFGAPLEATLKMAQAIGLNFFAVTDHSYDLDDSEDSWIQNDDKLPKWHRLWGEVEQLNQKFFDFIILPGEEVSVGNHQNRNVHLLILNERIFFKGQGDSAERWFKTKPDLSIEQVLARISDDAIAIAGHPEMPTPFLQWLLIRRGQWHWQDFQHNRLNGFQIWNGEYNHSFYNGSASWSQLLLNGKKLSLIAGNDAHGNFNRFRQIGFPFFTFRENNSQLFGNMRTGIKLNEELSIQNLIQAVKDQKTVVSNGPIIDLSIKNLGDQINNPGQKLKELQGFLSIQAKSSKEFGKLESIKIFRGDLKDKREYLEAIFQNFSHPFAFQKEQNLTDLSTHSYIRAELTAKKTNNELTRCLTNPVWINTKE